MPFGTWVHLEKGRRWESGKVEKVRRSGGGDAGEEAGMRLESSRVRSPNPGLPQVLSPRAARLVGVTCAELAGRPPRQRGRGQGQGTWSAVPMEGVGDGVKAGSRYCGGGEA